METPKEYVVSAEVIQEIIKVLLEVPAKLSFNVLALLQNITNQQEESKK